MSSSPVEFSIAPKSAPVDAFRDRRPPWSEDAERAVLAAMMLAGDAIITASELVSEDMFYREGHRRLFRAMMAINHAGAVVDPLTLSNELEQRGDLAAAGGKEYIGGLLDEVPTAANVEHHCRIVRDKALRRRLIETATALVREGHESPANVAELLDMAEHKILELNESRDTVGFVKIKQLLWDAMERIEHLRAAGGSLTGVPSGLTVGNSMMVLPSGTCGTAPGSSSSRPRSIAAALSCSLDSSDMAEEAPVIFTGVVCSCGLLLVAGTAGAATAFSFSAELGVSALRASGSGVLSVRALAGAISSLKSRGPIFRRSPSATSCSPLTTTSLMRVPFVLLKSRTKTLPSRMRTAQCCLLTAWLAGRSWHCGSRPTRNCDPTMGTTLP